MKKELKQKLLNQDKMIAKAKKMLAKAKKEEDIKFWEQELQIVKDEKFLIEKGQL